jgi:hypothetical protein
MPGDGRESCMKFLMTTCLSLQGIYELHLNLLS